MRPVALTWARSHRSEPRRPEKRANAQISPASIRDGRERVLIEAKFWAGLTGNQPVAYLQRLPANTPSALLFVAPAPRLDTLWNELRRTVAESESEIELGITDLKAKELRSAIVGGKRHLLLTSWRTLLGRMQDAASSDSHTEKDIAQLHGLATQEDEDAFLPLRREELGPEFARRILNLRHLVDQATNRAVAAGFANVDRLRVTPQAWGYGRFVRLAYTTPWFGVDFYDWAEHGISPLWLWFSGTDAQGPSLRALEPLRRKDPTELFEYRDGLVVPVELPVGVEYDAVLAAVVERFREISNLFSGS